MTSRLVFACTSALVVGSWGCSSSTPSGASVPDASEPRGDGSAPASDGDDAGAPAPTTDAGSQGDGPDLDMQPADFVCILGWSKVGDFRITNLLVDAGASIAVAEADGGTYPVGTVIQLIPNEAIVKRRAGFDPSLDDWEFFNLTTSASGTVINQRGGAEVTNASGSCAGCHEKAEAQFDFVCGTTHGCAPLPFTEAEIQAVQNGDPRCQ
jgi:hypothetical protein